MDLYTISFIISTLWIGPFWFAMLIKPYEPKTKKLLNKPLFFLGPIFIWFIVMIMNPIGLIDELQLTVQNYVPMEEMKVFDR